ncbi:MAG TPA: hypothetical protein PK208_05305 [Fibrobacteria bacterium]|nr:hypothetical protein [Fibrobacteria bacterium]
MPESSPHFDIPEGFSALLKIEGGEADRHQIRMDILVELLNGLQRISYLLAAAQDGLAIGERFKPSRSLTDRYALRCGTAIEGSYAIPLEEGPQFRLPFGDEIPLFDAIQRSWEAVANNDFEALRSLLPGPQFTARFAREVQKFLPGTGSPYRIGFRTKSQANPVYLTPRAARVLKEWLQPAAADDAEMTVTGKLMKIDFDRKIVTIKYQPTQRSIDCSYLPQIEDSIVESRAEPIQVTGKFVLDEDGYPAQLTEVSRIQPIDLSPVHLAECPLGNGCLLRFRSPLDLDVALEEDSGQYLEAREDTLGIFAFALNRELLIDELEAQIQTLWAEYALADDESLAEDALGLKRALLAAIEQVEDV